MNGPRIPIDIIKKGNLNKLAEELLGQYRKSAKLYQTSALLVPLGDDFTWGTQKEWDLQYKNYKKLIQFINKNYRGVEIRFGTLEDYFRLVKEEKVPETFPMVSGNFFTYADRYTDYWSGFYSLRPFWKRMGRELESYLRSSEIMYSLYLARLQHPQHLADLQTNILDGRKALSLFQHHDAITGTCRSGVIKVFLT